VIGAEPDHDPVTADNSDPSMSEPVIDGATVFDGRIPATRLLTRVVADVEPAAFFRGHDDGELRADQGVHEAQRRGRRTRDVRARFAEELHVCHW